MYKLWPILFLLLSKSNKKNGITHIRFIEYIQLLHIWQRLRCYCALPWLKGVLLKGTPLPSIPFLCVCSSRPVPFTCNLFLNFILCEKRIFGALQNIMKLPNIHNHQNLFFRRICFPETIDIIHSRCNNRNDFNENISFQPKIMIFICAVYSGRKKPSPTVITINFPGENFPGLIEWLVSSVNTTLWMQGTFAFPYFYFHTLLSI